MRTVYPASDSSLWVASSEPGLSQRLPDGTWQLYGQDNPFERDDIYITDIIEDTHGSILVGTDNWGVYRYDTNGAWTQYDNELPSTSILSLSLGLDGSVWAGTTNGAARLDGVNWQSFEPALEGLMSGFVYDVYVAPNGDVYFATDGGISRYRP
jgi:ligand-binding sensor domain-containing protein